MSLSVENDALKKTVTARLTMLYASYVCKPLNMCVAYYDKYCNFPGNNKVLAIYEPNI